MPFYVEVKSKPKRSHDGVYRASFGDGALQLEGHDCPATITVPVGTKSQHENATVRFKCQDAIVSMRVLGLTLDNNRLAKALSLYLRGKREEPDFREFRVSYGLLALAMLPIAIPIVTRGGAIAGSIGGTLLLVCFLIAKNPRGTRLVRALIIVGIVVAGIFGALASQGQL